MSDRITTEDLSGPVIDRRTTMKLFGAGGMAALAGCTGGGQGSPTATETQTKMKETTAKKTDTPMQDTSKGGGKIIAAWHIDEILNLDPVINSVGQFEQVSMNLYSGLLRTTKNFEIRGDLAEDWTVKDPQTYEFKLVEGAQFHGDYGEITAQDVQDVIHRGVNAEGSTSKPKLKQVKTPIKGTGVEVLGDYRVRINLSEPFVPFIKALTKAGGACNLHPVQAVEDMGRQKFKTVPVGSGPFEVESHKVGQRIVMKAHDGYHRTDANGNQLPYLDEVEVKTMPESATMLNALLAGDVHLANQIPLQNLSQIQDSDKSKALQAPAAGWIALYLNPNKSVFDSPKKRRGIAKIFNSKEFVEQTFFGNQMPAIGPIGPAHGPFFRSQENKPDYQKYDPDKGEQLIKETGIEGEKIVIHTQKEDIRRARGYKQQLQSHFDVQIKSVDTSTYLDLLDGVHPNTPKKQGYFSAGWGSDIDIAVDTTLYFFFKSPDKGGAFNDMLYSDPQVDKWLEAQRRETDLKKRVELIQKVEDRVMKDAPAIYTHHIVPWQAIGTDVKGYTPHPFRRDFESIRLSQ